jgi:hypothetical protein
VRRGEPLALGDRVFELPQGRFRRRSYLRRAQFEDAPNSVAGAVSAAYHGKYDRYGPAIVGTVVSPQAEQSILRLVPR